MFSKRITKRCLNTPWNTKQILVSEISLSRRMCLHFAGGLPYPGGKDAQKGAQAHPQIGLEQAPPAARAGPLAPILAVAQ